MELTISSGNLTRAAETVNLTVSALSHQMRQLEQRLGYPLLLRQPRGVRVTPEGQRLLDQVAPHQGFLAFRDWLHAEAAEHALHMNTAG